MLQGQQRGNTKSFNDAWRRAHFVYTRDLRVARRIFAQDPEAVRALLLAGARKKSFGTWLGQVSHFYAQLLTTPAYLAALDGAGLRQPILEKHQQLVAEVQQLQLLRERTNGDAKQRRRERDDQLRQLEQWVAALRAVAEVALVDKPALLRKLTLPEPAPVPTVTSSTTTEEATPTMPPVYLVPS